MSIRPYVWIAICGLALTSCAKILVVKVPSSGTKIPAEGVFYALPRTVIRAQVKIQKTDYKGAEFSKFAPIFAPGMTVACKKKTCMDEAAKTYSLKENVTLSSYGEPDPERVYLVKFAGSGALDQEMTITWNEAGLISTASATVTNRTTDLVLSAIKLAGGLSQRMAFGAVTEIAAPKCPKQDKNDDWIIPAIEGSKVSPYSKSLLIQNYCALDTDVRTKFSKDSDEARLKAALEVYWVRIDHLITGRQKVLRAENFVDDPVGFLARFDALIVEQLRGLFVGSKSTTTAWDGTLDVRDFDVGKKVNLLRIDAKNGVCVQASLAPTSKPIPTTKDFKLDCAKGKAVTLEVTYHPDQKSQVFYAAKKRTTKPVGDLSFRYRIPAQTKAEVSVEKKTYGTAVLSVAQLGYVAALPAKRKSKKLMYDLGFIESTGGLKSFKLTTTGSLDSASLDSLGTTVNSLLDARATARDAAEAEADELARLQRQANILEAQNRICEALLGLGRTCEFRD